MSKALVLLSFLLACLVGVYAYLELGTQQDSGDMGGYILPHVTLSDLTRLQIIKADESTDVRRQSAFEQSHPLRKSFAWVLREPLYAPVDTKAFESLVQVMSGLQGEKAVFRDATQEAAMRRELDVPHAIIILTTKSGLTTMSIGQVNDLTGRTFVQVNETLYVTEDQILKKLEPLLASLRAKNVLSFDINNVRAFEILSNEQILAFKEFDCGERWQVATRPGAREYEADTALTRDMLNTLVDTRVKRIVDDAGPILDVTGLTRPFLLIGLSLSDASAPCPTAATSTEKIVLQFGKSIPLTMENGELLTKSSYYLKISGETPVYEIDEAVLGQFLQELTYYRDKKLLSEAFLEDVIVGGSIVYPPLSCAIMDTTGELQKEFEALAQRIGIKRYDILLTPREVATYVKFPAPTEVSLRGQKCYYTFRFISRLGNDLSDAASPFLVERSGCEEETLYGLLAAEAHKDIESTIATLCQTQGGLDS